MFAVSRNSSAQAYPTILQDGWLSEFMVLKLTYSWLPIHFFIIEHHGASLPKTRSKRSVIAFSFSISILLSSHEWDIVLGVFRGCRASRSRSWSI